MRNADYGDGYFRPCNRERARWNSGGNAFTDADAPTHGDDSGAAISDASDSTDTTAFLDHVARRSVTVSRAADRRATGASNNRIADNCSDADRRSAETD